MSAVLKAPFPWPGGKSRVAPLVWERFGNVSNYVEPFFGSGAVLLGRPGGAAGIETVNDLDGFVANFWRAVSADAETVWEWADTPVSECDLHARHLWLLDRKAGLAERLMGDPDWFDAQVAGWWVWGICSWIGSGWCSGSGPWVSVDGVFMKPDDAGQGVNRQRPHLGDAGPLTDLAVRLRDVRVCCGDWQRILGPTPTTKLGTTAVFLDPPYAVEDRTAVYTEESFDVAHDVRAWCAENGHNPDLRIALCGYEEHDDLAANGWTAVGWKAHGGYGSQSDNRGRENATREVIWFSPHCLGGEQQSLFGGR